MSNPVFAGIEWAQADNGTWVPLVLEGQPFNAVIPDAMFQYLMDGLRVWDGKRPRTPSDDIVDTMKATVNARIDNGERTLEGFGPGNVRDDALPSPATREKFMKSLNEDHDHQD